MCPKMREIYSNQLISQGAAAQGCCSIFRTAFSAQEPDDNNQRVKCGQVLKSNGWKLLLLKLACSTCFI